MLAVPEFMQEQLLRRCPESEPADLKAVDVLQNDSLPAPVCHTVGNPEGSAGDCLNGQLRQDAVIPLPQQQTVLPDAVPVIAKGRGLTHQILAESAIARVVLSQQLDLGGVTVA